MTRVIDKKLPVIVAVVAAVAIGAFVTSVLFWVNATSDTAQKNKALICQIDELFGLDKPLSPKTLKHLRPSQRHALNEIIKACPNLSR